MQERLKEQYKKKLVSVEEALSHVKSGDVIATSLCGCEPRELMGSLHTLKGEVEGLTMLQTLGMGDYPFLTDPSYESTIEVQSMFFMGPSRRSHQQRLTTHIPGHLHLLASRWLDYKKPNIFFAAVAPMDRHGYFRTSLSLMMEKEFAQAADLIICEINTDMPQVAGETEIHISEIDYLVESTQPVPTLQRSTPGAADIIIGQRIAELVNDGDTIQIGIGSIPDAAALSLMEKKDLGVHTEMLTNCLVDLVEAGVVTGRKKSLHPGKIVGTFALGDESLYRMIDQNPAVMLQRARYVNDPAVVARNDNMVSINTGLAVDLTGQVCSESIGPLQYSGSGGQNDMAEGAVHAKNGRSIIALRSTAKSGTISTISSVLQAGSVVTLSRNLVDYVVTEHGVAPLRGRTIRERVDSLIAVAHPDFRSELRKEAEKNMLW